MSATTFLASLPSRGILTDTQGITVSRPPAHVCDYDTSPPEDQVIRTDPVNILIRALTSRRKTGKDGTQKPQLAPGNTKDPKGKRNADSLESPLKTSSSKRERRDSAGGPDDVAPGGSAGQSVPRVSKAELEGFTVERLRAFLKDRGLSTRGRKEELLSRAKKIYNYK